MVKEKFSQIGESVLDKIDGFDVKDKLIEHSFNHSDILRDEFMLKGALASEGYDWWWHSFTGHNAKTGEEKAFFRIAVFRRELGSFSSPSSSEMMTVLSASVSSGS